MLNIDFSPRLSAPKICAVAKQLPGRKQGLVATIVRCLAIWQLATHPASVYAVHLDVEIWSEGSAMQAGFCRTPGAVGCDLAQLIDSLNLPANTLPIESESGRMIFLTDFRDFSGGPYKTPNPGFQSVEGALGKGELISYQAMGILEHWNITAKTWEPAPPNVRIKLAGAIDPDYIITDFNRCNGQLFCFADGFDNQTSVTLFTGSGIDGKTRMVIDATNNRGSLHTHLNFFLENGQGVLGGSNGAYLLEMRVLSNNSPQPSTPFLVMFNAGLSKAEFSEALMAKIDTLSPPLPPIANAGADRSVDVNDTVVLDGLASNDPDTPSSELNYQWLQTAGLPVALSGADSATPRFVPSQAGLYLFRLTVGDGSASASDEVAIKVVAEGPPPLPPFADAGDDKITALNLRTFLDATASRDPEPGPNPLRFTWQQTAGPSVALEQADTATPSFIPTQTGRYAFRVAVDDGALSAYDEVTVVVPEPPQANAGADKLARLGSNILLDGSASRDHDPGPGELTYHWQQTQGDTITISGAHQPIANVIPTQPGNLSFKLAVGDGAGTGFDEVTYTVPALGDIDLDGDIDRIDVALILVAIKKSPIAPDVNDIRDLDGNGKINSKDASLAKKRCTLRQCRPSRR